MIHPQKKKRQKKHPLGCETFPPGLGLGLGILFQQAFPQVETQSSPVSPKEQTRSLEVLDRNMQNVSREITAILSKIEEDGLGPTVC